MIPQPCRFSAYCGAVERDTIYVQQLAPCPNFAFMFSHLQRRWKAMDTPHAPDCFIYTPRSGGDTALGTVYSLYEAGVNSTGGYRERRLLLLLCILLLQECATSVRHFSETTVDGLLMALCSSFMLTYSDGHHDIFIYESVYYLYCIVYCFFCMFTSC